MNAGAGKRLTRLLEIRRLKEASRRQEYGLAMRAEEEAKQAADARKEELETAQGQTRDVLGKRAIQPDQLRRLHEEVRFRERLSERSELVRRQEAAAREIAERAYQHARRDSKSLEKLQERYEERTAVSKKRAEQLTNDEAALRRFIDASSDAQNRSIDRRI